MKKLKKKNLVYIFMIAFVFALVLISNSHIFKENSNVQLSYVDIESSETKALVAESFKNTYGSEYKTILSNNEKANLIANQIALTYYDQNSNEVKYPNSFGGQYINDNNELVIQIVKDAKEKSILDTTKKYDENIVYEYVNNSYEELNKVNDAIIAYFTQKDVDTKSLSANYVDTKNNIVVVELKNNTLEEQEWFKSNVIDSPLIRFVKNEQNVTLTSTYNAGGNINNICSIGFRARMNGVDGFMTAAHCFVRNENVIGFGVVTERIRDDANGIDGEFIALSSGNTVTNNLQYPVYPSSVLSTLTSTFHVNVEGGLIAKEGFATQLTKGVISNTNYSYTDKQGNYFAKFILTNVLCNNGDSGGVVFQINSLGNTVAGIVHAKICTDTDCKEPGPMIYSNVMFLDSNFNLTRY